MASAGLVEAAGVVETVVLEAHERDALRRLLGTIDGSPYGPSFEGFRRDVTARLAGAPGRLRDVIQGFKTGSGPRVIRFRGMPAEFDGRPTPTVPYHEVSAKVVGTERYLVFVAVMLGEAIGFGDWHAGDKLQNLYPIAEMRTVQCASNSVYLEMHTETAFRPRTPTHLTLFCIRRHSRRGARTVLCDLRRVIDSLDDRSKELLKDPLFGFQSYHPDGSPRPIEGMSVDTRHHGRRRLNYAEALVGTDGESQMLLDRLKARIAAESVAVEAEEGDLFVIDNRLVVHGRTPYEPLHDGSDRWLQRVLVSDLEEQTRRDPSDAAAS
jgi:L-asparagine oxygenase